MADTYLDSSVQTSMNDMDFNTQKDTLGRMDAIINKPAITYDQVFPQQKPVSEELPRISSYLDALHSSDYRINSLGQNYLNNQLNQDTGTRLGVGQTIDTPFTDPSNPGKFINKKYGYDVRSDNEDYYYKNDYMNNNAFYRNAILNPLRFIGRVAGGTVAKLGESLGYMGAMIGSIGSENYMANVADNSFSKWFEKQEQTFKDNIIPVYKQAGFDEKGFFSKLGDWTFWNDSVSDGVAFMASAIAQTYLTGGLANLTKLGQLGSLAINTEGALGKFGGLAGKIGKGIDFGTKVFTGADDLGGIGNWAFNTASEAAFEMKGVYGETKDALIKERADGKNTYTDSEIDKVASQRAASDFKGNLLALSISNAFENRFIFQPIKKAISGGLPTPKIGAVAAEVEGLTNLDTGLKASEKTFEYGNRVAKFTDWKNPMGRLQFYGKRAATSAFMEGLYEENVQLAIERMSVRGDYENKSVPEAIYATAAQTVKQAKDAFQGKDKEAAESIGLGALIGIGGTAIVSKLIGGGKGQFLVGERKAEINAARTQMENYNKLRREFLSMNDVFKTTDGKYERDEEGNLVYDEDKINARADGLRQFTDKATAVEAVNDPIHRSMLQADLLADYIHAADRAGILPKVQEHIANIENKSAEEIAELGFNPAETIDINAFRSTFDGLVQAHKEAYDSTATQPKGVKPEEFEENEQIRKFYLFKAKASALSTETAYNEVNKALIDSQLRNQPSIYAPDANNWDPTIRQYNSLTLQEQSLNQFADLAGENGEFYTDYIENKRKALAAEKIGLEEILQDKINNGEVVDRQGLYVSKNTKKNNFEKAIDLGNTKKHAQLKNALDQWQYAADKLGSPTDAYNNFQAFKNYHDNIVANDIAEDNTESEEEVIATQEGVQDGTIAATVPIPTQHVEAEEIIPTVETHKVVEQEQKPSFQQDIEEVADIEADSRISNDPSYIDTNNPISWLTPNKTSTKESTVVNDQEEVMVDDNYNQIINLFIRGINTYAKDKSPYIVNDRKEWVNRFPADNRIKALSKLGQVIIFEGKNTTLKVGDIPSFAANPKFKPYLALPIVMSFNTTAFDEGITTRAQIKAEKNDMTIEDVLEEYAEDKQRASDVRAHLAINKNDRVPIIVSGSTEGIFPRTRIAPVTERFGKEFTVRISTSLNGLRYKPGTVVADFGQGRTIPVTTKKVLATPFAQNLKDLYNHKFNTEEEAEKVKEYFKTIVYTNLTKFFMVQSYENGKYFMIDFFDKERPNADNRKSSQTAMLGQNMNVNNKVLSGKKALIEWKVVDGNLVSSPIQSDRYGEMMKDNVLTTIKKVTLNNELYTEKINPYFTFAIDDARFLQTSSSKSVKEIQNLLNKYSAFTQEQKDNVIKVINGKKSINKQSKLDLIKQVNDKPTITLEAFTGVEEETPLTETEAEDAFGNLGEEVEVPVPIVATPEPKVVQQAIVKEPDMAPEVAVAEIVIPDDIKEEDMGNVFGNFGSEEGNVDDSAMNDLSDDKPLSSAEQNNNKQNDCD